MMKIRTALQNDIPALAELLHELFVIEADFTPDFAVQAKGLALLLSRENCKIFVAEVDGNVVGMCTVQIHISTAKGREVGVVEDVVVDLEHRGKRIGAALLRTMEEWASDLGLARLQLLADSDNHPALGFYRRQGWHSTNLISWMKHL
ncbi:MAG: GNAT family N-acetyltransferase [Pontiella sp.]